MDPTAPDALAQRITHCTDSLVMSNGPAHEDAEQAAACAPTLCLDWLPQSQFHARNIVSSINIERHPEDE
ncbi:hypothetical protein LL972_05230 [Xanthomonas campestris pv. asclepiadis]|nr:hypothetical protein [Xanthomonas campestris pv. asclepiadis]